MPDNLSMDRLQELRGQNVYDQSGDKIGSVEEIFYDEQTNQPEWIGVGTGFFGTKRVLVPVKGADVASDGINVPYAKDQVKGSPDIDGDEISESTERDLYAYYGIQASQSQSDTVLPEGGVETGNRETSASDRQTDRGDGTITRHEEELRVGKTQTEAGRARVRKWVETEPVQANVTLQRETARVERETINEPVSDAQIGEDSIEVPLREEQAMVDKQVVAKERIRLDKDVETRDQTVSDEVRRERVEVEGDVTDR